MYYFCTDKPIKHLIMQKKNYFLRLTRHNTSARGTEGKLELFQYQNEKISCIYTCDTLEPGSTSLDIGQYIVKFTYSPKFSSREPYYTINNSKVPIISSLLNGVSLEHRGIRIHCGNTSNDTNGCILVGRSNNSNSFKIYDSRLTYEVLMSYLKDASNEVLLIINDETLPF